MRTITLAAAALLVVLAGSGIAGASVVTLSVVVTDSTLSLDGVGAPTSTTFSVYATVSDNTWYATSGGPPAVATLWGGIKQFETQLRFTGTGQVHPTPDTDNDPAFALQTFNTTNFLTTAYVGGLIVDAAGAADPDGTGGLGLANPGQGVMGSMAISTSTTAWRAVTMGAGQKKFTWGNTDSPYAPYNDINGVLLYTGELNAVDAGTVHVAINPTSNMRVWTLKDSAGALLQLAPTSSEGTSFDLTILGGEPENIAPTVSIPGGDVLEEEWTKESGWNNLLHSVEITAAGEDPDNGPVTPLTYEWTMSKPGGGQQVLTETGDVLHLTLAEIASLGLPDYVGKDDPSYHWFLSVTSYDGDLRSEPAEIGVFVPEPATIGLLAFGVVGLLKRRRRA